MDSSDLLFECGICMDNKPLECIDFLPCIHFVCIECREKLVKNECPFCRHIIDVEKEEDSYDEAENEYHDVQFEMLVMDPGPRTRAKSRKIKKQEKRIMKLLRANKEIYVNVNHNTFRVLSNINEN